MVGGGKGGEGPCYKPSGASVHVAAPLQGFLFVGFDSGCSGVCDRSRLSAGEGDFQLNCRCPILVLPIVN